MIGADFEKIKFKLFGFDCLEPMALVTDSIVGILSIYFAYRLFKFSIDHPFYKNWMRFFLYFGLGAFAGGFAHAFYNYWDFYGKLFTWFMGPVSIYFMEKGMIAAHPSETWRKKVNKIALVKLIIVVATITAIILTMDVSKNNRLAFLPVAINTIVGVVLSSGVLGNYLAKRINPNYKYIVWGVIILSPSALLYLFKINLHQWFDKNDFAHILMAAAITYFFIGIRKVAIDDKLIKE
ncbi:MAG: hypothetical protein MK078_06220 [Crocinitomicaceae bacterium]|nr:hypothetical protein [Crocinitomicaceae bacterium]